MANQLRQNRPTRLVFRGSTSSKKSLPPGLAKDWLSV
jgi:hypothetical protein